MQINAELQADYETFTKTNSTHFYSRGVVEYAERWAQLMETALGGGKSLNEIWESTSHEADTDGITGYMYGCAVQILSKFWVHGQELARLHNRKHMTDQGDADQAARDGKVVNPAILEVS